MREEEKEEKTKRERETEGMWEIKEMHQLQSRMLQQITAQTRSCIYNLFQLIRIDLLQILMKSSQRSYVSYVACEVVVEVIGHELV